MKHHLFAGVMRNAGMAALVAVAFCLASCGNTNGAQDPATVETPEDTKSAYFTGNFTVGSDNYDKLLLAGDGTYALSGTSGTDTGTYTAASRSLALGDYVLTSSKSTEEAPIVFGVTIKSTTVELTGSDDGDSTVFTVTASGTGETVTIEEQKATISAVTLTAGSVYECMGAYQYAETPTKVHAVFPPHFMGMDNEDYMWIGTWEPTKSNDKIWQCTTEGYDYGNERLALIELGDKLYVVYPNPDATKVSGGNSIFGTWVAGGGDSYMTINADGTFKMVSSGDDPIYGFFSQAFENTPGIFKITLLTGGENAFVPDYFVTDIFDGTLGMYQITEWNPITNETIKNKVVTACAGK